MIIVRNCRFLVAACILLCTKSAAQNMTSPYTVYGIGNIEHRPYNVTSGIGGTGLALKSTYWLINNNPASIAGLYKSFYLFDIGLSGRSVQYSGDPIPEGMRSSRDFGAKRAAFAVKITDNWAASVGFRQYSTVNYKYRGSMSIEGTSEEVSVDYEGDGGLNNFYLGNALSIGKHLSVGINLGVISGSINRTEYLADAQIENVIETKVVDFYSKARLEYGMIYNTAINKQWQFSLGGRLSTKADISPERTLTVKENGQLLIDDELVKANRFHLPFSYGAGIAFTKTNSITIAADYLTEQWKPLNIGGSGWSLVNSHRFSGGIEISKIVQPLDRAPERRFFQFGGFLDNSYLSVNSNQVREYGVTVGYGSNYRSLLYSASLEIGQRGTVRDGLIKENYFQVTIGLSYRDFLFSKGRKYD